MPEVIEKKDGGIVVRIRLTPNASRCGKVGFFTVASGEEYLKISVTSIPEKGKANKELIDFLSKALKIPKTSMEIISGFLDRHKKIFIKTEDETTAERIRRWTEES